MVLIAVVVGVAAVDAAVLLFMLYILTLRINCRNHGHEPTQRSLKLTLWAWVLLRTTSTSPLVKKLSGIPVVFRFGVVRLRLMPTNNKAAAAT